VVVLEDPDEAGAWWEWSALPWRLAWGAGVASVEVVEPEDALESAGAAVVLVWPVLADEELS
jgi:putative intracellular protease/amidase